MNSSQDKFVKLTHHPKKKKQDVEVARGIDVVMKEEVQRIKKKAQEKNVKQNH